VSSPIVEFFSPFFFLGRRRGDTTRVEFVMIIFFQGKAPSSFFSEGGSGVVFFFFFFFFLRWEVFPVFSRFPPRLISIRWNVGPVFLSGPAQTFPPFFLPCSLGMLTFSLCGKLGARSGSQCPDRFFPIPDFFSGPPPLLEQGRFSLRHMSFVFPSGSR